MSMLKTYSVSFWVRDHYTISVKARSAAAAVDKAEALYLAHGEDPANGFEFDIADGGADIDI